MKTSTSLKFLLGLVFSGLILTVCIGILFVPWYGQQDQKVELEISRGSSLSKITRSLKEKKLIQSDLFYYSTRILGKSENFKSGYYLIDGKQSLWSLMKLLESGKSRLISFTIVEGNRNKDIFKNLQSSGLIYKEGFNKWHTDKNFLGRLKLPKVARNLEGFLFPETYKFAVNLSPKDILISMVRMFYRKIPADYSSRAKAVGLSFYQAVILASIIEKETGAAHERKLISSVFHNRLKKGMRLQTDPTVIYGIRNFNGNLTRKHLRTYTPYNTYRINGLPPTPIASPGYESLMAAVDPAKSRYLYFVAKGNGEHYFSTSLREHNRAVRKYQKIHRNKKNYRSY